ncbi:MAG: zinc ribbon domain-containing protein [Syntrophaceae bacterium]|nr:zinc ribbon domain-containing protein [Syntrophaceae bacterium]
MPIYEFHCKKCGHNFEYLCLSQKEVESLTCPKCKSQKIEKMMSVFGGKIGNTSTSSCGSCSASSCPPS